MVGLIRLAIQINGNIHARDTAQFFLFIIDICTADEPAATVIDGKSIAEEIRSEIADEVCRMKDAIGKVPGLAVILVGQRKDSQSYVRNKIKACQEVGIASLMAELPEDCEEDEVLSAVSSFNGNPSVHGILVQLPLPQVISKTMLKFSGLLLSLVCSR